MEDEHLPEDSYELVVLGTGLVECIVAGAAARVGRRVVHRALLAPLALPAVFLTRRRLPAVDPNDFYGGDWASFQLEDLVRYARSSPSRAAPLPSSAAAPDTAPAASLQPLLSEPAPRFVDVEEWRTPAEPARSEAEAVEAVKAELSLEAALPAQDSVRPLPPGLPRRAHAGAAAARSTRPRGSSASRRSCRAASA